MTTTLAVAMTPERFDDVCAPETRTWLDESFEIRWGSRELRGPEVDELVEGSDVVLTSWGTPPLSTTLLTSAGGPTIVAHAAGSVKRLIEPEVLTHGVAVFSAGGRIAQSVGEYCLGAILTLLRRLPRLDDALRAGGWKQPDVRGSELTGRTIGIVGASSTARALIRLLQPFSTEICVYDPYLSQEAALALGARPAELADIMGCDVVSLHVPSTPETEGLIDAELVRLLRPGAVFVNSARGSVVDASALEQAIRSGGVRAALDVFDPEPAALSAEMRRAPDVLLTPHIAGDTIEGHRALTGYVMADAVAWLRDGTRGPSFVRPEQLAVSA